MRRICGALLAMSLLVPAPALMKSCSGMGHMDAGSTTVTAQAYLARETQVS